MSDPKPEQSMLPEGGRWREAALAALIPFLFYWPLLRPDAMQSGGDAANLFWPVKRMMVEAALGQGVVPLWNPWSFMGAPLLASLQHAVFYPPDWLLYALFPAHVAMNLGNLFHLALAAAGMWLWLRGGIGLGRLTAVVLGGAFPCVAWFWGHQEHINQVASAAWLPGLTAVAWLFLKGRIGARLFAMLYSAGAGLQFMTGHPQEAFYTHLLVAVLGLGVLITTSGRGRWLRRAMGGAALAAVATGLIVAVQLLPTLELNHHSRRQFRDPLYAISFSMPPDVLLSHFSPHREGSFRDGYYLFDASGQPVLDEAGNPGWNRRAFGEYGVYVGLPILLLALFGLAGRRRLAVGLLLIVGGATLLSLGGNTDPRRLMAMEFTEFPDPGWSLHELFLRIVPPAQGFRVPARIVLLASFALVTLGAMGLEWLLSRSGAQRQLVAVGSCIAIYTALFLPSTKEKFHFPATMEEPRLVLDSVRREEATLDERAYRLTMSDDDNLVRERHRDTTFGRGNPITWRVASLQPHLNVPARVPMVDGYEEGLVPTARFKDFIYDFNRNFRQFQPDTELLALLGVSHVLAELPVDSKIYPPDEARALPGAMAYRNPLAKGAAFALDGTEGIDFARIDGPFWRGGEPLPNISTEQVSFGHLNLERWAKAVPFRTTLPSPNRIDVYIESKTNGTLPPSMLALGWYPGWVVEGDRGTAHLEFASVVHARLPVDEALQRAHFGPEGEPGWRLAFQPFSYQVGLFLTGLGVALWAFLLRRRPSLLVGRSQQEGSIKAIV